MELLISDEFGRSKNEECVRRGSAQGNWSVQPEVASVLDSGSLGLTSGPVFDPEGNRIGTFNSIWRLNADGVWKIDL